jgi:cell wall-associated NlpC family hydrolase
MKNSPAFVSIVFIVLVFAAGQAYPATPEQKPAQLHKHGKVLSPKHRSPGHSSTTARNLKIPTIRHHLLLAKGEPRRLKTSRNSGRAVEQATGATQTAGQDHGRSIAKKNSGSQKLAQKVIVGKGEIADRNNGGRSRLTPAGTRELREDPEKTPMVLKGGLLTPWKNKEPEILTRVARSFVGAPYKYGGESVRGLDCSAFVRKMYAIFEVDLPRCAREQYYAGTRVDKNNLATGDLVFFRARPAACYPGHVGIYLGGDMFIHASSLPSRGVKIDHLSGAYFARTYMGAVRVKAPPAKEADGR